jgi:subtilisin family serine protease
VAGTIGATGNNSSGVAGVNWTASIMGLKFLGANGSGTTANAINAIEFAVQLKINNIANVRVLSNSWGGGGFSLALFNAITRANTNGIVFVAAAGNAASNNDASPSYPASYDVANVVAVAATDNRDNLASFSNYGASSVDLGAPGVSILSTTINGYAYYNGTSMATPHVSGAVALVLAACPGLSTGGVISAILNNVDPVPALAGKTFTGGRLNVHQAVQSCAPPPTPDFSVSATPSTQSVATGVIASYTISTAALNGFAGTIALSVTGAPDGATATFSPASVSAGGSSTLTVSGAPAGAYSLTITGLSGGVSRSTSVTLVVTAPVAGSFTISSTTPPRTVVATGSTTYAITVAAQNGFNGVVTLSAQGLPTGASASFSPASVTGYGSTTMTVSTSGNTPKGTYTIAVWGTSGDLTAQAQVTLTVQCKANGKCK